MVHKMAFDLTKDKRIRIIIGHYGSGKTEFAVNYALELRKIYENVSICDLDIVNPYFRTREKAELLEKRGVKVISGAKGHQANLDIPMVSPSILAPLQNPLEQVVLDVGGDAVGARVLARFKNYFTEGEYDMLCVINANREQTQDAIGAISHIRAIEETVGVKVTGLINNTHLIRETMLEDVLKGQKLVHEVSEITGIPIRYVSSIKKLTDLLPLNIKGAPFPIHMYMREDWM